jgi:hypothetical protein
MAYVYKVSKDHIINQYTEKGIWNENRWNKKLLHLG